MLPDAVPVIVPVAEPEIVVLDNDAVAGAVPSASVPHVTIAGIVPVAVPVTVPLTVALEKLPDTDAPVKEPDVVAELTVAATPVLVA